MASEESEPNDGWPYDQVLKKLAEGPQLSTAELAAHIVHAYIKSYKDRNYKGAVTQAAVDLSKVKLLTGPLDWVTDCLTNAVPKAAREVWNAQRVLQGHREVRCPREPDRIGVLWADWGTDPDQRRISQGSG